ncbi:MAG: LPP20 family lipoprotein [Treponema sp.]|jgi:hypothetical protein|nr:LPP20 family lipoprotein [Treponema sp.]
MLKIKYWFPILILLLCAGCAGAAKSRGSSQGAGSQGEPSRAEPAWVSDADQVYSRLRYMAAVGYGPSRAAAEKEAFASMVSVFGQTVQVDRQSMVDYSEALRQDTVSSYIRNTEISNAIKTSSEVEILIGAEIRDYWYDGRGTHYAVAVMEKSKAAALYAELVDANREIIGALTAMDEGEKYSFSGYARCLLAAKVAGGNRVFAGILSVVGGPALGAGELAQEEQFRLEALDIARNIPLDLRVENDRNNRIRGAFAAVIGAKGFLSGGGDSPYTLDARLEFTPVDLPGQENSYVRYVLDAGLTDTRTGTVLLPYTISGREGHLTEVEAENRALRAIEQQIARGWEAAFSAYLDSLSAGKR